MPADKTARALELAVQHHQAGRLAEAEALYRQILAHDTRCAGAWHGLGVVALQSGQYSVAAEQIAQAATYAPRDPAIHANLGEAYRNLDRLDEAVESFRRALALQPEFPTVLNNLANALMAQGRVEEGLGCCREAIALEPTYANAYNNLGIGLTRAGRPDEAIAPLQRAILLNPALADAHNNLGSAFVLGRRLDESLACYQRALALRPDVAQTHDNLGGVWKEQGRLDEAVASYRRARALNPGDAGTHSNLIFTLQYLSGHDAKAIETELQQWNEAHARPLAKFISPHRNDPSPDRRLRIGYVSPDFRSHPVGWFLRPLLAAHDRQSVELFCYSNATRSDQVTAELRAWADGWREIAGQSDEAVADLIRADRIDLLVDLALHAEKNRLLLFARKPAPVQATYLAYPGSSGLAAMDYRLTDLHLDPADPAVAPGREQPVRLPETYWCYQPVVDPPPAPTPPPALTNGYITFGCLNSFCKITPATLAAWRRLLGAMPAAQLLLHAPPGCHRSRLQAEFADSGLDPRRVRFADFLPAAHYFELYRSIDLGLDPFPFPGGTTTCDALWMGVPVVTLAGPTPVTRGGLSLLSNVGLPELIAHTVDEYVEKAAALARDLPRLATLRASLRDRMRGSPLMDAPRFARHLEAAYRTMWHRWCAQSAAASGATR